MAMRVMRKARGAGMAGVLALVGFLLGGCGGDAAEGVRPTAPASGDAVPGAGSAAERERLGEGRPPGESGVPTELEKVVGDAESEASDGERDVS